MDTFDREDLQQVFMDSHGKDSNDKVEVNISAPRDR